VIPPQGLTHRGLSGESSARGSVVDIVCVGVRKGDAAGLLSKL
jgi:hypothetical protein